MITDTQKEATQSISIPGGQGCRDKAFLAMPGGGGEGKPSGRPSHSPHHAGLLKGIQPNFTTISQPLQSLPLQKTLPKGSLTNMMICMPGPCQSTLHKFHTANHLIRNAQHLSFRMHHNFKAEDFVGQISVVGRSISFGNVATTVCQKLTQKYLILLRLQLTRPGFGTLAEDDSDPWAHWQNWDPCTASCQKRSATDLDKRHTISFTPHFQRKVEHLRWPKVMQKAAKIYGFHYWFWQGEKLCVLLIFQVMFWLIFMGSKSISYKWKKVQINRF